MTSTTDRLLADLIAHIAHFSLDSLPSRNAVDAYAADRLAWAEGQAAAAIAASTPTLAECLDLAEQRAVTAPAEPPCADWIDEARKAAIKASQAHPDSFGGRFILTALDAFIAAMPQQSGNSGELARPQPEEVPQDLAIAAWQIFLNAPERFSFSLVPPDHSSAFQHIWNAARRYAPMPARVTDEMEDAFRELWYGRTVSVKEALEAVLAAAPVPAPTDAQINTLIKRLDGIRCYVSQAEAHDILESVLGAAGKGD